MTTNELFKQLENHELSHFDALNIVLNITQKEQERIKIFIGELENSLFCRKVTLNFRIGECLKEFFQGDLMDIEDPIIINQHDENDESYLEVIKYNCKFLGFKKIEDIPAEPNNDELNNYPPNYIDYFLPNFFNAFDTLKADLEKYITPQTNERPTPKKGWGLVARYNFLDELDVLKTLETSGLLKKDLQTVISQILGCNIYTARDLINGEYNATETKNEQLERKQLISLIKYKPTE